MASKTPKGIGFITVVQAAAELNVSPRRVRALIQAGRLLSTRLGLQHVIRTEDLEAVRVRKYGRPWPKKETAAREPKKKK